ncbi:hypothetical protein V6C42_08635 [Pseudoclostridium thermosuccinogenes]
MKLITLWDGGWQGLEAMQFTLVAVYAGGAFAFIYYITMYGR